MGSNPFGPILKDVIMMYGNGKIYSSKHYEIRYTSYQPTASLKPIGVWLRICKEDCSTEEKNRWGNYELSEPILVKFDAEPTLGFFDYISGNTELPKKSDTFQPRLKEETLKFIRIIDRKENDIVELEKRNAEILIRRLEIDRVISEVSKEIDKVALEVSKEITSENNHDKENYIYD
jgi:hypothetical protein